VEVSEAFELREGVHRRASAAQGQPGAWR
jgi:hypothetical protein